MSPAGPAVEEAPAPSSPVAAPTAACGRDPLHFTVRVRIPTGLACNARCSFCYYGPELNRQSYGEGDIPRMLRIAARHGIRDIDFSGGEPTVVRELPEWIAEARRLGFRRVCIITNGIRTADRSYIASLAGAGLDEVLVSVQGATAEEHDGLVGVRGAFSKVLRTLRNAADLGLRLRINHVVARPNAASTGDFAWIPLEFRPAACNFICFNDWVNAAPAAGDLAVRYSEAAPGLREAVGRIAGAVSKVTVRYIPFCFLPGLEPHVCGLRQNDFDGDEWNDAVKRAVTDLEGPRLDAYCARLGDAWRTMRGELEPLLEPEEVALLDGPRRDSLFAGIPPELSRAAHRIENWLKRKRYVKSPACRECSRDAVCDGLEPAYAEVLGTGELRPVPGPAVLDPMEFRRPYAARWD